MKHEQKAMQVFVSAPYVILNAQITQHG